MIADNPNQPGDIEEIIRSIDFLDEQSLRETLAYIIKIYIIDKEISYDGKTNDDIGQKGYDNKSETSIPVKTNNFLELIRELRNNYSIPGLDLFSIENENVYITIDGKKYSILDEINKNTSQNKLSINNKITSPETQDMPPERFKKLEMD